MTTLVIVAVVLFGLAVWQRKAFGRVATALGAQFGKLARKGWQADPIAVYQAEVDRSADEIREATGGLEQSRGLVARLQRQVANGEKEVARITARVKSYLTEGNENKAAEYAVMLQKEKNSLEENLSQLTGYEQSYQNNLKKIQFAHKRIQDAKDKAARLQTDLRMSKAEAETAKLAEKFNIRSNTLEGLGEIEEEIQRQIDQNRGKAQVIQDLSSEGLEEIAEQEKMQKIEAQEVLTRMKAEMGIK